MSNTSDWQRYIGALNDRAQYRADQANRAENMRLILSAMQSAGQLAGTLRSQQREDRLDGVANALLNREEAPRAGAVNPNAPGVAEAVKQFGGATKPHTGGMSELQLVQAVRKNRADDLMSQMRLEEAMAHRDYYKAKAANTGTDPFTGGKATGIVGQIDWATNAIADIDTQIAAIKMGGVAGADPIEAASLVNRLQLKRDALQKAVDGQLNRIGKDGLDGTVELQFDETGAVIGAKAKGVPITKAVQMLDTGNLNIPGANPATDSGEAAMFRTEPAAPSQPGTGAISATDPAARAQEEQARRIRVNVDAWGNIIR
jgi:hypothetical protein